MGKATKKSTRNKGERSPNMTPDDRDVLRSIVAAAMESAASVNDVSTSDLRAAILKEFRKRGIGAQPSWSTVKEAQQAYLIKRAGIVARATPQAAQGTSQGGSDRTKAVLAGIMPQLKLAMGEDKIIAVTISANGHVTVVRGSKEEFVL